MNMLQVQRNSISQLQLITINPEVKTWNFIIKELLKLNMFGIQRINKQKIEKDKDSLENKNKSEFNTQILRKEYKIFSVNSFLLMTILIKDIELSIILIIIVKEIYNEQRIIKLLISLIQIKMENYHKKKFQKLYI